MFQIIANILRLNKFLKDLTVLTLWLLFPVAATISFGSLAALILSGAYFAIPAALTTQFAFTALTFTSSLLGYALGTIFNLAGSYQECARSVKQFINDNSTIEKATKKVNTDSQLNELNTNSQPIQDVLSVTSSQQNVPNQFNNNSQPTTPERPKLYGDALRYANQRLIHACKEGNISEIIETIEMGAEVNCTDDYEKLNTPLHHVCLGLSTNKPTQIKMASAIIKLLIENGANPFAANGNGYLPIHIAAINGTHELFSYFNTQSKYPQNRTHKNNISIFDAPTEYLKSLSGTTLHNAQFLIANKGTPLLLVLSSKTLKDNFARKEKCVEELLRLGAKPNLNGLYFLAAKENYTLGTHFKRIGVAISNTLPTNVHRPHRIYAGSPLSAAVVSLVDRDPSEFTATPTTNTPVSNRAPGDNKETPNEKFKNYVNLVKLLLQNKAHPTPVFNIVDPADSSYSYHYQYNQGLINDLTLQKEHKLTTWMTENSNDAIVEIIADINELIEKSNLILANKVLGSTLHFGLDNKNFTKPKVKAVILSAKDAYEKGDNKAFYALTKEIVDLKTQVIPTETEEGKSSNEQKDIISTIDALNLLAGVMQPHHSGYAYVHAELAQMYNEYAAQGYDTILEQLVENKIIAVTNNNESQKMKEFESASKKRDITIIPKEHRDDILELRTHCIHHCVEALLSTEQADVFVNRTENYNNQTKAQTSIKEDAQVIVKNLLEGTLTDYELEKMGLSNAEARLPNENFSQYLARKLVERTEYRAELKKLKHDVLRIENKTNSMHQSNQTQEKGKDLDINKNDKDNLENNDNVLREKVVPFTPTFNIVQATASTSPYESKEQQPTGKTNVVVNVNSDTTNKDNVEKAKL